MRMLGGPHRVEAALFHRDRQLGRGDRVISEKDRGAKFHGFLPIHARTADARVGGSSGQSRRRFGSRSFASNSWLPATRLTKRQSCSAARQSASTVSPRSQRRLSFFQDTTGCKKKGGEASRVIAFGRRE